MPEGEGASGSGYYPDRLYQPEHVAYPDLHDESGALTPQEYDAEPHHTHYPSGDGQEGLGPLVRLVEALEMYEPTPEHNDPMLDSYQTESVHSQLLGLGKQHRPAPSVGDHSLAETYTSEMNPKLKGKHVPALALDTIEDEFCAPPYTHDAAEDDALYDEPDIPEDWPRNKFSRKRRINWPGSIVMSIYIIALCFYIWVRTTKTMGLGAYVWWGVLVFVVEMLGASTTLLYGMNLIWLPVNETPEADEERHGLTKALHPYHIRVMIPAYKETLEIVAKTVHAAYNAPLPYGCLRTIYVCDDGKDSSKRKWVEQMGPEIVYVSGRTRAQGEMNGKSANLNNCANQIYPADLPIPPHELICIFDADQVANADFFLKMVPLFDAGDDVGMVLSPQAFHNIDVRCDVFNHSNVQFWEYAQVGYDALPFISCTGTNFLIRSVAFREAGWMPEYTLTEDYALGMELTRLNWQCRYVSEYLAIGEAPHETRNCFQQRSRWCKGHFQIVLDTNHCPLFLSGLTWFQRVMYCSGVWAYVVGALSTPFFVVVPLVTIWAGIFPIIVSWWAALAITVYFCAQFLVLNFVRSHKHLGPLWFATVANSILWWTFVKGFWRAFSGTKLGNTLTFKTTLKGNNKFMNTSIGDLWIPALTLAGLIASFVFGLRKVIASGDVITTLSISLVWIVYSMLPPLLLMWYNFIGRGGTLRFLCTVCFYLSTLCGLCAIILLWLVYPKDFNYSEALVDAYTFYKSLRIGTLPQHYTPSWRSSALTYEADPYGSLAGGYVAGGGAGVVKLSIPIAFATSFLAWSAVQFPKGYEKAKTTYEMADSLKWSTDYLLSTMSLDAKGTAQQTSKTKVNHYFLVYQVGNYTQDQYYYGRLEAMTATANPRPVYFVTTANGTSDIAGQYIAAFASTAMVYEQTYNLNTNATAAAYYDTLMTAALELYGAATTIRNKYSAASIYNCAPTDPTDPWGYTIPASCTPPDVAFGGSMVYWYNSTSFLDDLSWAAGWMYRATQDPAYLTDAIDFYELHNGYPLTPRVSENSYDDRIMVNWDQLIYPAGVQLAQLTDGPAYHIFVQEQFLAKWLCTESGTVAYTAKGRAYNLYDPSLGQTMNSALLAVIYGSNISPNSTDTPGVTAGYSDGSKANRYICYGRTQSRYVLGDFGRSLVSGFGSKPPQHAQFLDAVCSNATNAVCTAVSFTSPQPNANLMLGALMLNPETWDHFVDNRNQNPLNNDTYVSLENNAGFTGLVAALNSVPGSYSQCLQGYGILAGDSLICSAASYQL